MKRDFWRTFKAFTKDRTYRNNPMYTKDGVQITSQDELEHLVRHYEQQFKITEDQNDNFCHTNERRVNSIMQQRSTTNPTPTHINLNDREEAHITTNLREVKDLIKHLPRKAPGISQINKQILSQVPDKTLQDLVTIYNASLQTGVFPTPFKHSIIIPIQKPNKPNQPQNYRPISLLEVPAKILERIAIQPLLFLLEDDNILNTAQHGFRALRGTDTALAILYETISVKSRSKAITIASRDVSGAFDRVWHNGLKYKITNLDLPNSIKRFYCSYLDNRTARIKFKGQISQPFPILAGVPQGAILSPTLYNVYLADIPEPPIRGVRSSCTNIIYADDVTQIIGSHYSKRSQKSAVESYTNYITTYEKKWKISTNISKFQITPFHSKHPSNYNLQSNKTPSNECKILGLTLKNTSRRENLTLCTHVADRIRQAEAETWKIAPFNSLPASTKITLYKVLVRPKLTYPAVILNTIDNLTMLNNLQKTQNNALRLLTGISRREMIPSRQIHQQNKVEPINIFLQRLSKKTWEKIQLLEPETYEDLQAPVELRDSRFPSSLQKTLSIVEPFYTRPRNQHANHAIYHRGRRR